MIRTKNGRVKLVGSVTTLMADLASVVGGVQNALTESAEIPEEMAKNMIEKAISVAFKSKEELRKEAYEVATKLSDRLFEELFGEESKGK